jgi:hypothetical protein
MRLLLGISMVVVLSACGANGAGDDRAPDATRAGSASVQPSVSLDAGLADAAEELASALPSGVPSDLPPAPEVPSVATGEADATITADPDDYRVEGAPSECGQVWREGGTLPSPYQGCTDGDLLVAAEGKQGDEGIYYAYDGLCAGAGERIRRC